MEMQPPSEYCPRCQSTQPIFQFDEDGVPVRRCQTCGFPVETGLALETDQEKGIQATPEIKILCVDDDPLIREMLGDILRFRGYSVATAADGEVGLEAVTRDRPDLILLDVMMPGLDGFEVCRRIKADPELKQIPVIILTAMNDPKLNARAFEAGAALALRKTADAASVLRTIEAALAVGTHRYGPPAAEEASAEVEAAGEERPEQPENLSVPTRSVTATFWTVDGASFEGSLSLHLNAEAHQGPETVLDRLNDPDLFLTVRMTGDVPVVFLNKIQLIRADVPPDEPLPEDAERAGEVDIQAIKVQLINGEYLQGTVRIEGPSGRRRLSDFLNTQPAFLPLAGPDHLHLLHKRFIARIFPQRG
jgi:CheY-like chemotaxis protein/Zn ribbon nucleic-acid-binding protein